MPGTIAFDSSFQTLTGHPPFPWQRALHARLLAGDFPKRCDLPTGMGKTAVIPIWVLALAERSRLDRARGFPRRLVYVVNRRTVVDQATRDAERIRSTLQNGRLPAVTSALAALAAIPTGLPVAISTLRGQFADNAEWRDDPARPSVVVGTVDMIGSRLLFSGYGRGFKSRPLHAGFLGQDVLLVHDEAHLEPAFQELVSRIEEIQQGHDIRPVRVLALSATGRRSRENEAEVLRLTEADWGNPEAVRRLRARKALSVTEVQDAKALPARIAHLALRHETSGQAVIVFLQRLEHVDAVVKLLAPAAPGRVQTLTGTLRGLERDRLATHDPVFGRFIRNGTRGAEGTVYLVCTSAGEVGVDLSAGHMVSDLTPFDSMAQRLGRVNRFGEGDARIDVVHPADAGRRGANSRMPSPLDEAVRRTRDLLELLPLADDGNGRDASPAGLIALPGDARLAAFSPPPTIPVATDVLFDAWALTTARGSLPGRPAVADWLHGEAEWEPPDTQVAWREEVDRVGDNAAEVHSPDDLLDEFPLEPHEVLRDRTARIREHLERLATASPDLPVWLQQPEGDLRRCTLRHLVEVDARERPVLPLDHCTVVLPPSAGGLRNGRLDGTAPYDPATPYDVSCMGPSEDGAPTRQRVWDDAPQPSGMRLVRQIDTRPDDESGGAQDAQELKPRIWRWYVRPRAADDEASSSARLRQMLPDHASAAAAAARKLVHLLDLDAGQREAVVFAAEHHDDGKARRPWQRSLGNVDFPAVAWAKSDRAMPRPVSPYRHEFGSLSDVQSLPEFNALSAEVRDLALHLIGAHHGRARPHFPADEVFDPRRSTEVCDELARAAPRRFGRLQRRFGRWGLAWLESLVRAADAIASKAADETSPRAVAGAARPGKEAR